MCTDRIVTYKCGHPHSTESPSQTCEHHLVNLKHPPSSPQFAFYRADYFVNVARCELEHRVVELKFEYNMCATCELEKTATTGMKRVTQRRNWTNDNLRRLHSGRGIRSWEAYREETLATGGEGSEDGGKKGDSQEGGSAQSEVEEEVEDGDEEDNCE